jgi:hypothetical protein
LLQQANKPFDAKIKNPWNFSKNIDIDVHELSTIVSCLHSQIEINS